VTRPATVQSGTLFYCKPTVTGFNPPNGSVGTSVTLTGTSLTGTTAVSFGGFAAIAFTVNSNTQITANVQAKAKTGKIKVTTPEGSATSRQAFNVN
jgi:IPT/TIG domain-containing protein